MNRHEALRLVNKLLDPETPMDEKQRAAAQLSELIRILLPESDEEQNDLNDNNYIRNSTSVPGIL